VPTFLTWAKESLVASTPAHLPLATDDEQVSVSALPLNLAHNSCPLTCTDAIHGDGGINIGWHRLGLSKIEWQKGRSTVTGQVRGLAQGAALSAGLSCASRSEPRPSPDLGWLGLSGNALCGCRRPLPADLSHFAVAARRKCLAPERPDRMG
jgi:hypothetical protein